MLVAQKKYNYHEQPVQYEPIQIPETKVREIVVTKRGAIRRIKALLAIILVFGLSLFILFRYTQINEYNHNLVKIKKELSQLHKVNSQLRVELDTKIDLNKIEQEAVQKLGMQYPDKNQTIYMEVQKKDFTEIPLSAKNIQQKEAGIWGTVSQGFSELVGYLY